MKHAGVCFSNPKQQRSFRESCGGWKPRQLRESSHPCFSLADVLKGEVIIWREGLQTLGMFEIFRSLAFDGISDVTSPEIVARIKEVGVERLHEYLSVKEVFVLIQHLTELYQIFVDHLIGQFVDRLAPVQNRIYFCSQCWVRIMMPSEVVDEKASLVRGQRGQMVVH